jgi:hypothetical protein
MTTLMGQSYRALVAQDLLVDLIMCRDVYDCCGTFVWPSGKPEDWEVTREPVP